jgi:ABC-2 type transport system permease protein
MSAVNGTAPAPLRVPAPVARGLNTRLLRSELRLIFGRRRNQAGLLVLAAVPILIAVAVKIASPSAEEAADGPDFLGAIAGNGMFVALAALSASLPMFLPIAVAAISGDAVAGEANLGTLRYLLTVPVHRTRLLAVKYAAVLIFTFVAVTEMALVGVLVGLLLFGGGPVTLLSGDQASLGEGLLRLLAVCGYLTAMLAALGAIGLFVSTLTEQPIGATIAIVMLTVISFILDAIPQLHGLHPYLVSHWWMSFGELLRDPVDVSALWPGLRSAAAYSLIFLTAAWARFAGRDVTS